MAAMSWRGGSLRFGLARAEVPSREALRNVAHIAALTAAGLTMDERAVRAVGSMSDRLRTRLAHAGVLPAVHAAAAEALESHVARYLGVLTARRRAARYVEVTGARLRTLLGGFATWREATEDAMGARLTSLTESRKWSAATLNAHVTAVRSLAKWCVRVGVLPSDPTPGLERADNAGATQRRALTLDEARVLLDFLRAQPGTAPARALTYEVAVQTGLRRAELASLTVADFDLDGEPAIVRLPGARTKNGRDALLPIPADLAGRLREAFTQKMPGAKALGVREASKSSVRFREDVDNARAAWVAAGGNAESDFLRLTDGAGRVLVFHSLRHSRGVWLFEHQKATPREAMDAMRVGSLALVERYSRSMKLDVDRLAATAPILTTVEAVEVRATGTENAGARSGAPLGLRLGINRDVSGRPGVPEVRGVEVKNHSETTGVSGDSDPVSRPRLERGTRALKVRCSTN